MTTKTPILVLTAALLLLPSGCKSDGAKESAEAEANKQEGASAGDEGGKEAEACRAERRMAAEMTGAPELAKIEGEELARCIEEQKQKKTDLELDDAQYEAYLDCQIAAKDLSEVAKCLMPSLDAKMAAADAEASQAVESALARLEAHVDSGVVTAKTLASFREPPADTPSGRVAAVATDAADLVEAGRVAAGETLAVRLQPGLGPDNPTPKGLEGAELSFVDAKSGLTVGRLAPLTTDHLGAKTPEIEALLEWVLEDPNTRQLELVVTASTAETGLTFEPPKALEDAVPRFAAAGLADREVIWLDGEGMTLAQWAER